MLLDLYGYVAARLAVIECDYDLVLRIFMLFVYHQLYRLFGNHIPIGGGDLVYGVSTLRYAAGEMHFSVGIRNALQLVSLVFRGVVLYSQRPAGNVHQLVPHACSRYGITGIIQGLYYHLGAIRHIDEFSAHYLLRRVEDYVEGVQCPKRGGMGFRTLSYSIFTQRQRPGGGDTIVPRHQHLYQCAGSLMPHLELHISHGVLHGVLAVLRIAALLKLQLRLLSAVLVDYIDYPVLVYRFGGNRYGHILVVEYISLGCSQFADIVSAVVYLYLGYGRIAGREFLYELLVLIVQPELDIYQPPFP